MAFSVGDKAFSLDYTMPVLFIQVPPLNVDSGREKTLELREQSDTSKLCLKQTEG